jgi:hypothetical protein
MFMIDEHPCPGSPRCSTASSTPTSSNSARPNIPRPRRAANWNEVWDSFDRRKKRANDEAPEVEVDMFAKAGIAAE